MSQIVLSCWQLFLLYAHYVFANHINSYHNIAVPRAHIVFTTKLWWVYIEFDSPSFFLIYHCFIIVLINRDKAIKVLKAVGHHFFKKINVSKHVSPIFPKCTSTWHTSFFTEQQNRTQSKSLMLKYRLLIKSIHYFCCE